VGAVGDQLTMAAFSSFFLLRRIRLTEGGASAGGDMVSHKSGAILRVDLD